MVFTGKSGQHTRQHISRISVLYHAARDKRISLYIKILALLVIAYVISPVDFIPDFIPVLGLVDELIIVPVALSLIAGMIPDEVISEYQVIQHETKDGKLAVTGIFIVICVWLFLIGVVYAFLGDNI